jgi:uncharacterized protein
MTGTQLFTDVDLDGNGKQLGWLYVPHSANRSAYGNICVPIAVVRNGDGPTAFLVAGSHGDEYEGQVALCRLIRELSPECISGRVIILPAANYPAASAGTRLSPVDGGNLNRAFPGSPTGTPTEMLANYIEEVILPLVDVFCDFHSGGETLDYLPVPAFQRCGDLELDRKAIRALCSFGAPTVMVWSQGVGHGLAASAAARKNVVGIGGEFGGAARLNSGGVELILSGVRLLLAHFGVLESPQSQLTKLPRIIEVRGREYYVIAPEAGLFEPVVALGDDVAKGAIAGWLHFIDNPLREPRAVRFSESGVLVCLRPTARSERGDVLAHIATDVDPAEELFSQ